MLAAVLPAAPGAGAACAPGAAPARLMGSWPRRLFVEPHPVRIADANLGHAVLLGQRAGHLAVERGAELRLDIHFGQADAPGLHAVRSDHDVRIAQEHVRVHVQGDRHFFDHFAHLFRQAAEHGRVGAKNIHFDRRIHAGQVADLILDERNQLDLQLRHLVLQALAQRLGDFAGLAPLAGRLQAHQDVAGIGLRREQPQFGPRAADVARNVVGFQQDRLDAAEHLVGLGQRRAHGHVVVDDDRAFVHLGHEAQLEPLEQQPPGHNRQQRGQHGEARPAQTQPQQSLVAVGQQVVERARRGHGRWLR